MTLEKLNDICKRNNIPDNVHLYANTGWECCETEIDGVYYNDKLNAIVFQQQYYGDTVEEGTGAETSLPQSVFRKIDQNS